MASIGASLRTAITAATVTSVGSNVFRDVAPDTQALPFVTFATDISREPQLEGDGRVKARKQVIQVDLWQSLTSENVAIVEELISALDGATLTGADKTIFKCKVANVYRLVELDAKISHHALDVEVFHS
tara:strand:- start:131 stop:517 length:387 start_codon:yes stop_codon:yes gene_type:complete